MNETKRRYKRKCGRRTIDFALHENDLYEFSKQINFAKVVKATLKSLMEGKSKWLYIATKKGGR